MSILGKLVGGIAGLALGGPVGAAIGAALGHAYDSGAAAAGSGRAGSATDGEEGFGPGGAEGIAARFFVTTFEIMGHVAKADGRVSEREIGAARRVMQDFRLDAAQVRAAIAYFTQGKQRGFDPVRAVMALRRDCAGRPDLLRVFLEIQMRAALEGANLQGAPRAALARVATMLGVGTQEFAHLEAIMRYHYAGGAGAGAGGRAGDAGAGANRQHQQNGRGALRVARMRLEEAYEILEIEAGASDDDVVKAYRRQLSKHHPDKLKANGLPESMLEHAKQRTQLIIEAYERIRAERGTA